MEGREERRFKRRYKILYKAGKTSDGREKKTGIMETTKRPCRWKEERRYQELNENHDIESHNVVPGDKKVEWEVKIPRSEEVHYGRPAPHVDGHGRQDS